MKLLKVSISSFLVLCFVLFAGSVVLAESSPTTENPGGDILIATANIRNAKIISQDKNVFNISFDVENGKFAQSGVKYGISLVDNSGKNPVLVDDYSYPEIISLSNDNTISKSITYTAPSDLNGEYDLYVILKNSSDLSLSIYNVKTITLTAFTKELEVLPKTCSISVGKTNYTLANYISIKPSDTLKVSCSVVNNTDKEISVSPVYETHYYSVYGDIVSKSDNNISSTTINSKEKKTISFELPKLDKAREYVTKISFVSGELSSDSVTLKYTVSGISAYLKNISLDKDSYKKDEIAKATIYLIPSFSKDKDANILSANISINSKGKACTSPLEQVIDNSKIVTELSLPIISKCKNPQVSVSLKDGNGNILDSQDLTFETAHRPVHLSTVQAILIILGILVVAGVATFYFIKLKKKSK